MPADSPLKKLHRPGKKFTQSGDKPHEAVLLLLIHSLCKWEKLFKRHAPECCSKYSLPQFSYVKSGNRKGLYHIYTNNVYHITHIYHGVFNVPELIWCLISTDVSQNNSIIIITLLCMRKLAHRLRMQLKDRQIKWKAESKYGPS